MIKSNALQVLKCLNPLWILLLLFIVSWLVFGDSRMPGFVLLGFQYGLLWFFLYCSDAVYITVFALLLAGSVCLIVYSLIKRGLLMYFLNGLGWMLFFLLGVVGLGFGS